MAEVSYEVLAVNKNGREGGSRTVKGGSMAVDISFNQKEGTTNPEELFALGWSACFHGALGRVKRAHKVRDESLVGVQVQLVSLESGGFSLAAEILVGIENQDAQTIQTLAEEADQTCAYSNATRGNIEVSLKAVDYEELAQA